MRVYNEYVLYFIIIARKYNVQVKYYKFLRGLIKTAIKITRTYQQKSAIINTVNYWF